jgi:signal transduction histidine kinase
LLAFSSADVFANQVYTVDVARALLQPLGMVEEDKVVILPHRWDKDRPGKNGRITYEVLLPPITQLVPYAVFINRVGNQVAFQIGNEDLARYGDLSFSATDSAKAPRLISIPATKLSKTEYTWATVVVTVQGSRWGGLSELKFGPASMIQPLYDTNYRWRQSASLVICLSLSLMGMIAAGLWWKQRDPLFGFFALTALFGVVRMGDRLLPEPPLDWPLWGVVTGVAFILHLMMMARFCIEAVVPTPKWIKRFFVVVIAVGIVGAATAFLAQIPMLWTATLGALSLPGLLALFTVAKAWSKDRSHVALMLFVASLIVVFAALRDFFFVRLSSDGFGSFSVLPHAVFVFVLFMAWIIVLRYSHQAEQLKDANRTLEDRVQLREQQLNANFDVLRKQDEQNATLVERQRIMRDIHDGVGAQLVGLLNLINKNESSKQELQEHANAALDELRIAIDSLQPVEGDLAAVLATLRFRLQPRIKAVGIQVLWEVEELPALDDLGPTRVLQVQRILLEAFTNVIKHAGATTLQVMAKARPAPYNDLLLQVVDNGRGFEQNSREDALGRAHGLRNMQVRALAMGARIEVSSKPNHGTTIALMIPR